MLRTATLLSAHDAYRPHSTFPRVSVEEGATTMLMRYLEGWAAADTTMIVDATADGYDFHDPLVGHFSRRTLPQYFALLRSRFAAAGVARPQDLAFMLRGPMPGPRHAARRLYWREAPHLGLTGESEVLVTQRGIATEVVAYDLNMASEVLRGCHANALAIDQRSRARPR
jgi:hypothetical protein